MLLLGSLGVDPWDVFHQGLSRDLGLGVGTWALIVSGAVLLLWIPLRQGPGLGTVCNAIVVGTDHRRDAGDLSTPHALVGGCADARRGRAQRRGDRRLHRCRPRSGPARRPDDGLGGARTSDPGGAHLHRADACSPIGWILGGNVGIGTVVYALSIGPLAHVFVPRFAIPGVADEDSGEALYGADTAARLRSWICFWVAERRPSGSVTLAAAAERVEVGQVLGQDRQRPLTALRTRRARESTVAASVDQRREPEERLTVGLQRAAGFAR